MYLDLLKLWNLNSLTMSCLVSSMFSQLIPLTRAPAETLTSPYPALSLLSGTTFYTECYLRMFTMGIYVQCIICMYVVDAVVKGRKVCIWP